MRKLFLLTFILVLAFSFTGCEEFDKLTGEEKVMLDSILAHWETWVPAEKKKGTAPLMVFKDLYQGLTWEQQEFLNRVRNIKPSRKDYAGEYVKKIENQPITRDGKRATLDTQYLPNKVYAAYEVMMEAMKKDLGKRLYVESGYRSPAYQLYTFLYYTPKHNYSIKETRGWVALPGHSEHGDPSRQAIDFVNEEGINGDSDFGQTAEDFEKLPEYAWLQKNAGKFGFELSYPRGHKDTTFEPWHWRYSPRE
jgi:LAS superfamily LD-carboxypeptidase LdcB